MTCKEYSMENPNPSRSPGREPGMGDDDDGDMGTDPRRTREPDPDDGNKREIPSPNQRPDQSPKTG